MFIPPASSASQAASAAAQAIAKETTAEASSTGGSAAKQASVEKSNSASPDRDAQGQGDGLPGERRPVIVDELEVGSSNDTQVPPTQASEVAPLLPDEPPSQIDIIG